MDINLEYLKEILIKTTGSQLLITGKGMGIEIVIEKTIMLYSKTNGLVLLLNATEDEKNYFKNIKILNKNSTVSERKKIYQIPGIYSISNNKVLSDMLTGIIDIKSISSILILNSEKIREADTITFIIEIYRRYNKTGILKAYTENIEFISYNPLTTLLKSLKLEKSVLFPRFHSSVKIPDTELTEIKIRNPFQNIQILIREIIKQLLKELESKFDYETVVRNDFKNIVKSIYNYRAKSKIRKLLEDIFVFRKSIDLLYSLDFYMFYYFFKYYYNKEIRRKGDTWINSEHAHLLMEYIEEYMGKTYRNSYDNHLYFNDEKFNADENWFGISESLKDDLKNDNIKDAESQDDENLENIKNDDFIFKTQINITEPEFDDEMEDEIEEFNFDIKLNLKNTINKNNKIKHLIKIIEENKNKKIMIISSLIQNLEILKQIFKNNKKIQYFLHNEIKYRKIDSKIGILLEPNLMTLRVLERNSVNPIVLFFKNSLEEEKYLNEIRDEKYIFEKIIREKSKISIEPEHNYENIENISTEILVDSRELRCPLPYYLYKNTNIKISMLPEGDYIIGNICIERKNIYDLIQSLNFRLYYQLRRASSKFTNIYLLLEFENKMSISSYVEKSNQDLIFSRFTLILKIFKIKIIWSNSYQRSVDFIRKLESKLVESNLKPKVYQFNPILLEILLSIPGVNFENYKILISKFNSLKNLIFASENEFDGIENGKIIYDFFRKSF